MDKKIKKFIFLLKVVDDYDYNRIYKVKGGKLYEASWDESHHNGDIENYKEEEVKYIMNIDEEIENLEKLYFKDWRDKQKEKLKNKVLKDLYKKLK